jgi:hypothetical protein
MSKLIVVDKAYSIVKECCAQVNPLGAALDDIERLLNDIFHGLVDVQPQQAGTLTLPGVADVPIFGPTLPGVGKVVFPFSPQSTSRGEVKDLVIPARDVIQHMKKAYDALSKLRQADPCYALIGCVARGFRLGSLDQKDSGRLRTINREWAKHWLGAGKHFPKQIQHTNRY